MTADYGHFHGLNGSGAAHLLRPFTPAPQPRPRAPMVIEWAEEIRPREGSWIAKGLLPTTGLACIYGPSRAGKSFFALEIALRIACGQSVLGSKTQQVGVAYVAPEAANGVRKRVCAWLKHHPPEDPLPFALIGRAVDFSHPESADVDELIAALEAEKVIFAERGERLGIVFVDTLARAMPGADENNGADMGAAIAAMERIGEALGILVCLVHHTGKDAARGARGHSSFFAALDTAFELTHDEEAGLRKVRLAKQKDDEDGGEWGFKLKSVNLGADADGDPITSCVVEYLDPGLTLQTKSRGRKQQAHEQIVMRALIAVESNGCTARPPAHAGCPSWARPVRLEDVRGHAFKTGLSVEGGSESAGRTRFSRAAESLCASNLIGVWEEGQGKGWIWRTKV